MLREFSLSLASQVQELELLLAPGADRFWCKGETEIWPPPLGHGGRGVYMSARYEIELSGRKSAISGSSRGWFTRYDDDNVERSSCEG